MMKKLIFALIIIVIFGCQADQPPKTEIIFSNLGQKDIENLWISIDGANTTVGLLKPGEQKSIVLDAIGNQRIDYGFTNDSSLRNKMGGELFFYGNQIPSKQGILEVGFENGMIRRLISKPGK